MKPTRIRVSSTALSASHEIVTSEDSLDRHLQGGGIAVNWIRRPYQAAYGSLLLEAYDTALVPRAWAWSLGLVLRPRRGTEVGLPRSPSPTIFLNTRQSDSGPGSSGAGI